jgi:hypothetical protein
VRRKPAAADAGSAGDNTEIFKGWYVPKRMCTRRVTADDGRRGSVISHHVVTVVLLLGVPSSIIR